MKFFLFLLLLASPVMVEAELNVDMANFRQSVLILSPYLNDKVEFQEKKNEVLIQKELEKIATLAKGLKGHQRMKTPAMGLTIDELSLQLDEVSTHFKKNHKDLSHWQLTSALGLCLSCHSQKPGHKIELTNKEMEAFPKDGLSRADLFFILRDFKNARAEYKKVLFETPADSAEMNRLYKSFNRLVFMSLRFDNDFNQLDLLFKQAAKAENLPSSFRDQVKILAVQLPVKSFVKNHHQRDLSRFLDNLSLEDRSVTIETDLYQIEDLVDLLLAKELYQKLEEEDADSNLKAKILFALSYLDQSVGNNLFYSLSNRYLLECVDLVPHSPQAQQCYQLYEDRIILAYTGSGGTDLPEEVREELEKFKKKATDLQSP